MYHVCNTYVYVKQEKNMGDLKKRKDEVDYVLKTQDGADIMIEVTQKSSSESKTIERLKKYIEIFYEKQLNENGEEEN